MKKIIEILEKINKEIDVLKDSFKNDEIVFVFRGEPRDYEGSKLVPSLFRDRELHSVYDFENKMIETLSDYKVTNSQNVALHKAIDAQHYISKSRLLDVTFNVLTSLYFACCSQPESNGFFYILAIPKDLVFSAHSKYLIEQFENEVTLSKVNDNSTRMFKLITYSMINDRIASQDGGFLMFSGHLQFKIPSMYYKFVKIDCELKQELLSELSEYFNITEGKIYPEKSFKQSDIGKVVDKRNFYKKNYNVFEFELFVNKTFFELNYYKKLAIDDENKIYFKRMRRLLVESVKTNKVYLINYIRELLNDTNSQNNSFVEIEFNLNTIEENFIRKVNFL